jgi:hypothetical protein
LNWSLVLKKREGYRRAFAAGSGASELPGFLPVDARCDRSRLAVRFGIGDSSG